MKNRAILLTTVLLVLYAGFNLPSCDSDVAQIELRDTHITEAISLAAPLQVKIEAYLSANGSLPLNNKKLGVPLPGYISGQAVRSVRIQRGYIKIKFKPEINNGTGFELQPVIKKNTLLEWRCQIGNINPSYFTAIEPSCLIIEKKASFT
ncbi:hypothetical protein MNBD_GAMMA22-1201 [hydrothermal vent metagenome]|uniref:Uncharacterized protein n=1 Tax=hydrothermal vent metagenome TaxID=652676 RepID=A0A3B1ADZ1_9ZZZZ